MKRRKKQNMGVGKKLGQEKFVVVYYIIITFLLKGFMGSYLFTSLWWITLYTCQVSHLRRDCHACGSKTWISTYSHLCSDLSLLVEKFEPLQH